MWRHVELRYFTLIHKQKTHTIRERDWVCLCLNSGSTFYVHCPLSYSTADHISRNKNKHHFRPNTIIISCKKLLFSHKKQRQVSGHAIINALHIPVPPFLSVMKQWVHGSVGQGVSGHCCGGLQGNCITLNSKQHRGLCGTTESWNLVLIHLRMWSLQLLQVGEENKGAAISFSRPNTLKLYEANVMQMS